MPGKYSCYLMSRVCTALAVAAMLAISARAVDTEKVVHSFTGGQ